MVSRRIMSSAAVIGIVGRECVFDRHSRSAGLEGIRFESKAHLKNDRYALLILFIVAVERRRRRREPIRERER